MKSCRVLWMIVISTAAIAGGRILAAGDDRAATPPPAPAGFVWQAIPELTDEFNGVALDETKWMPKHRTGRVVSPAGSTRRMCR